MPSDNFKKRQEEAKKNREDFTAGRGILHEQRGTGVFAQRPAPEVAPDATPFQKRQANALRNRDEFAAGRGILHEQRGTGIYAPAQAMGPNSVQPQRSPMRTRSQQAAPVSQEAPVEATPQGRTPEQEKAYQNALGIAYAYRDKLEVLDKYRREVETQKMIEGAEQYKEQLLRQAALADLMRGMGVLGGERQ